MKATGFLKNSSDYLRGILVMGLLFCSLPGFAQGDSLLFTKDLSESLLPLDQIIDIALEHSPQIAYQQALVRQNENQVLFVKRQWQNNIAGNASFSQGNQTLLLSGTQRSENQQLQANGYRVGLNINLPLYEFSGRKARIRLHQEELSASRCKQAEAEQEITREVIALYQHLIAAQRILRIRAGARESASVHLLMAEKQFRQGTLPIGEYARVSEIAAKAETEFEMARRDFTTLYLQFEEFIGRPMKSLLRKQ